MISEKLADTSGFDVCRLLRSQSLVSDSTAILILVPGPVAREFKLDALRAGASEVLGLPVDGEELVLRLRAYVLTKLDADGAREHGLIDPVTGLYNVNGLTRRARELGARAFRDSSAMACVIFSPMVRESAAAAQQLMKRIAQVFSGANGHAGGRVSDAIGMVSPSDIAIFAPETDEGARKLTRRLQAVLENSAAELGAPSTPRFQSSYFTVPNFRETPIEPHEMLQKASAALQSRN
jgi:CheY-like chemotaxis protein